MSVRARLTLLAAVLMLAVMGGVAVFAPGFVDDALVDDLLDTEAEASYEFLQLSEFDVSPDALDDFFATELGRNLEGTFEGALGESLEKTLDELLTGGLEGFLDLGSGDGSDPGLVPGLDIGVLVDEFFAQQFFVYDDLLQDSDELDELLALSGSDSVVVGFGGSQFLRVTPELPPKVFLSKLEDVGQPVMASFVLDEVLFGGFETATSDLTIELPDHDDEPRTVADVRTVSGVHLIVAVDASSVDRTVDSVRTALWIAVPLVGGLAAFITWILAGRALRPVRSITDQAATISGGNLDARVPVPATGDEIATLATTVNEMLDRLETDDRRRRRFVSDASHELRSPVAVMKSEAEVALRRPDEADVGELAGSVVAESNRMATMIDDLLTLARHDEGLPPPTTDVDLDDIVLAEARRARRVPVDSTAVSAGRVRGRADELTRMVGHLLDNAARHATSVVRVSLRTTAHAVVLTVDDDGPGIPVDQRQLVFERFSRLDEARSRDEGGAGLGLAVVAGIAGRSGGEVTVGDSDLGGARFVVTFPVAS